MHQEIREGMSALCFVKVGQGFAVIMAISGDMPLESDKRIVLREKYRDPDCQGCFNVRNCGQDRKRRQRTASAGSAVIE